MSSKIARIAGVQGEPVWGDLAATTAKTISIIEDAASQGVKLLAFPELWLPGYPFWIWSRPATAWGEAWTSYIKNSITVDGPEMSQIRTCCQANKIWILLGFSERQGSSLWMSTCWIDDSGNVIGHRRKIMPTGVERCLFGNSSGDSVQNVFDSPFGRIGSLQCWEHCQPLLKYHTASQHEQIHVASWPCLFPPSGKEHWGMTREGAWAASMVHALESGTFVIVATCMMSVAGAASMGITGSELESSFLQLPGGGGSRIYGPDGRLLAGEDLADDMEGLVIWDLDLDSVLSAKTLMDGVGHYSRPDIFSLFVNTKQNKVVAYHGQCEAETAAISRYPFLPTVNGSHDIKTIGPL